MATLRKSLWHSSDGIIRGDRSFSHESNMPDGAVFYVYVLISRTAAKRYVGQTDNLARRVAEHNNPKHNRCKFTTKHTGPWKLVHHEEFHTRSEAMKREKWLKSAIGYLLLPIT